jgi:threonine aldolase
VLHEEGAVEVLHGLRLEQLTSARRPLGVDDLTAATGTYAALCVELPLRDAGYLLPTWDELVALSGLARERGVPVHLDGARLWESQPFYGRTHAEIAALADTVYVSFYKGLGAIAGAALAGPHDVVDAARQWQHRHGGTLYSMHPFAASAREGLRELPAFAAYAGRAREVAAALSSVPGVRTFPDPPQVNAFVLYADVDPEALTEAALAGAERSGTWTFGSSAAADVPGWSAVEVVVGPATMAWSVDEVVETLGALVDAARGEAGT